MVAWYVDISKYIVLFFKISKSKCCTEACSFCIWVEERNYISLSCFMAYDNITLNRKSKKRNEITIYRKDPTLCPIILIPSLCTINEIILRQKIDTFIIFSLTEQKGNRKGLHKLKTNKRYYRTVPCKQMIIQY